jgi:outer membrane protein assembly factor BamB
MNRETMRAMKSCNLFLALLLSMTAGTLSANSGQTALTLIEQTGVRGGFIVHLGCGEGKLTAALRINDSYQVHGIDRDRAKVNSARRHIDGLGIYGSVSADYLNDNALPYSDNMVNLLVCEDPKALGIAAGEIQRVLVPNGVAYIKDGNNAWIKTQKPRPDNIDEWTHFLHSATGNAVAKDDVVGPPRHLQWIGNPRWSRHHDRMASTSAMVSANGRIFYIMDEGSRISIQLPAKWQLIARDAFNGTILWKRTIPNWQSHLWPLKSGPTNLARRLVAKDDRVFVTLGFNAPTVALDAATGKTLTTFADSEGTEELIHTKGSVYLLVNKGDMETARFAPKLNVGDQARVDKEFHWNKQPRKIMAFDAKSGERLWQKESKVAPLTLSGDERNIYFFDGEKVVSLGQTSGNVLWESKPLGMKSYVAQNFGPKLVAYGEVVMFAGGDRLVSALDRKTGREIWSEEHARGGYKSPEDLLVSGGLLWSAPTTSGRDSGVFTGRDPLTGEVKNQFAPEVDTYWFHHRCYIAKATDKYLLPSRTGIEFVNPKEKNWEIHHWVRGGCLYGSMPCNGLLYSPPHNCACYPEAKMYGLNALAPASITRNLPATILPEGRLEKGPAYNAQINVKARAASAGDWPTYRGNNARSGKSNSIVPPRLKPAWKIKLGGRLSALSIAGGRVFVARIDAHSLHALDQESGKPLWQYTTGGRIDSPPTIAGGRAIFGSADGWVYCLRASDGVLIWRFRAAPRDTRLMAMEQLESVWPVHGTILVEKGIAYFVAGRSYFLDGGLRFFKLDVKSGEKLAEVVLNDRNPETGKDLQDQLQTLQMPVGLPDILSVKDDHLYMRSQQFDRNGKRIFLGPHSGDAAKQGSVQRGAEAHLFSPTGFLDGSWFHRSYWVYGRSFAGGHNGYHQAGKFAPSGRILVFDEDNIFGFGRKPEYYRWTTTLEHQLFSAPKKAPPIPKTPVKRGIGTTAIDYAITPSLNPAQSALSIQAWINPNKPTGVVVAHGGPQNGYAIYLNKGKLHFAVRANNGLTQAVSPMRTPPKKWSHVAGVLGKKGEMLLYLNGEQIAKATSESLITANPIQGLQIGADALSAVAEYTAPLGFTGSIDEVRIFHRALSAEEIKSHAANPGGVPEDRSGIVLDCSFDRGHGRDFSGQNNHGKVEGAQPAKGKAGNAMRFTGKPAKSKGIGGYHVVHEWTKETPLFVRSMLLSGDALFIAGPPDIMDEEETFKRLTERDPEVHKILASQDAALEGKQGGILRVVNKNDGAQLTEYKIGALPVWDSLAASANSLYWATETGEVVSYSASGR